MIWFLCATRAEMWTEEKTPNLLKIDLISSTNIYKYICCAYYTAFNHFCWIDEFIENVKPLANLSNSIKNFNMNSIFR